MLEIRAWFFRAEPFGGSATYIDAAGRDVARAVVEPFAGTRTEANREGWRRSFAWEDHHAGLLNWMHMEGERPQPLNRCLNPN